VTGEVHKQRVRGCFRGLAQGEVGSEAALTARLRRYLSGQLLVHPLRRSHHDTADHVRIKPDLVFERRRAGIAYVADTKYKVTSDGLGREADYYQILAYATALNVPEGLLIYCQHDGTVPPRHIDVRNLGTRLATWAVYLAGTPATSKSSCRH
jgi:5-methylcytosine-specific restriction enzyme subunit McrC